MSSKKKERHYQMLVSIQIKHDNSNKIRRIQSSQGDGGAPAQQRERERERGELRRTACNKALLQNHTHTPQDRDPERRKKTEAHSFHSSNR
jgi:hypothetical protein